ncbi:MAG: multidrug ABC transporter [Coriobacteriales bacterium]|nr:multidrug ABC transporter [Coriobacteriales bacterium]
MAEISWGYVALLLISVFIGSVSQVLLKKSANKTYDSPIKEYLNPLVIFAYILFFGTTLLAVFAYRGIPLSLGPVLEATGYIYVTFFGVYIFKERMTKKKLLALALIIGGIVIYAFGL